MEKVIFIGAGGHAVSVADCLNLQKYQLCGFVDENKTGRFMDLPIFGKSIEDIPNFKTYCYFVSIGDVGFRKQWFDKVSGMGLKFINIIDPSAIISDSAQIGIGNFIGKYAVINAKARIGDDNIINTKALIEHECIVGSHVHLSTNSTINGNVIVDDSVFLGSTAVCNGQLKIGYNAVIGSGSVVINDVEACTTVVGVPATVVKRR